MNATQRQLANRLLRAVFANDWNTIDQIENEHCESASSMIDNLWDEAEHCGDTRLARRCETAYNRLTA